MATIQKRKNKNKTYSYKVIIRPNDGLPPTYKSFPAFQEAKDWSIQEEARRRQGIYFPEQIRKKHTLANLIDRYIELILLTKSCNTKDTHHHLLWWKQKLGSYTLNHISEIEKNESIEDAAIREIYEETGIKKEEMKLGPIVWFGEFNLNLSGTITRLKHKFIVVRTKKHNPKFPGFWALTLGKFHLSH